MKNENGVAGNFRRGPYILVERPHH